MVFHRPRRAGSLLACIALALSAFSGAVPGAEVFARVGDVTVTHGEYDQAFATATRSRFYHGKPPDAEIAKLQREVGDKVVNEILLAREARRRGIKVDEAAVVRTLDGFEARYRDSAQWKSQKATVLPVLRKRLETENLVGQLEKRVRGVPEPQARELEAYYAANKDKFTEPEQLKLHLILLKVDPSSPRAKWEAANEEGKAIVRRLRGGADFAALANLHSGDPSAARGGDLGFVHQGILPVPAQQALENVAAGAISEPVVLLEGVAIFRVEERKAARLNPLANVRERAVALWQREQGDSAWRLLTEKLRRETKVVVDESRFLPLAAGPGTAKP